jgi:hypothetical protein
MSESTIASLVNIVRLSLILMGLIAILELMRDQKLTNSFWAAIVKLFKRLL